MVIKRSVITQLILILILLTSIKVNVEAANTEGRVQGQVEKVEYLMGKYEKLREQGIKTRVNKDKLEQSKVSLRVAIYDIEDTNKREEKQEEYKNLEKKIEIKAKENKENKPLITKVGEWLVFILKIAFIIYVLLGMVSLLMCI